MVSTLEELKKKKARLLKQAGIKNANVASLRQRQAEEKKLRAEIAMLENPGSVRAKAAVKSTAKKFFGSVKRTVVTVANNAERIERERRERNRKAEKLEREIELARLKKKKAKKKVRRKKKRR